jgi:excisionase family DNA binding protein
MRSNRRQSDRGEPSHFIPPASETGDTKAIPFTHRLTCTIDEACEATGLGRTKLYELIGAGQLATTTVGRRRLIVVRSLLSLLQSNMSGHWSAT